ncbi:MAG: helix-turn-helix domain-containing protein [Phycisphaeraceae bacterium]|nr:helix-turn-helix domain-containing protein [Phycisphaeraceae bacterium]
MTTNPIDKLLPLKVVGSLIGGFCKRTVQRMIHAGELPEPVKVRGRSCLPESAVVDYLNRKKKESGA